MLVCVVLHRCKINVLTYGILSSQNKIMHFNVFCILPACFIFLNTFAIKNYECIKNSSRKHFQKFATDLCFLNLPRINYSAWDNTVHIIINTFYSTF